MLFRTILVISERKMLMPRYTYKQYVPRRELNLESLYYVLYDATIGITCLNVNNKVRIAQLYGNCNILY